METQTFSGREGGVDKGGGGGEWEGGGRRDREI